MLGKERKQPIHEKRFRKRSRNHIHPDVLYDKAKFNTENILLWTNKVLLCTYQCATVVEGGKDTKYAIIWRFDIIAIFCSFCDKQKLN